MMLSARYFASRFWQAGYLAGEGIPVPPRPSLGLLDELGHYLEDEGLGVLGVNLFLGSLPLDVPGSPTPDAITALVLNPGLPAAYVHDIVPPSRELPLVQALTRGAPYDYAAARAWAQQIWIALGSIRNQGLSGTWYLGCTPRQSVFLLRSDDYARPIVTCQYRIDKAT